jgi:hypothetical protein
MPRFNSENAGITWASLRRGGLPVMSDDQRHACNLLKKPRNTIEEYRQSDAVEAGAGREVPHLRAWFSLILDSAGNAVRLTRPHALFQAVVVGPQLGSFTVAPDGKKFLLNSSKSAEANTPFTLVQNWPTRLPR